MVWPIATKGSPFRGLAAFGSRHAPVLFGSLAGHSESDLERARRMQSGGRGARFLRGRGTERRRQVLAGARRAWRPRPDDTWCRSVRGYLARRPDAPEGLTGGPAGVAGRVPVPRRVRDRRGRSLGDRFALPEIAESDHATAEEQKRISPDACGRNRRRGRSCARSIAASEQRAAEERLTSGRCAPSCRRSSISSMSCSRAILRAAAAAPVQPPARGAARHRPRVGDRHATCRSLRAGAGRSRPVRPEDPGAADDLAPPGTPELAEIVRRPAEAAALVYETDARSGERLDDRLLADADRPDMLPLLQFTLQQLFDQRETVGDETRLTFAAYQSLGGLAGAIDKEAERAISPLDEAARERLPRLLRQLAAPAQVLDGSRDATRLTVRSIPMQEAAYDEASTRLVRALIDARILLSSGSGKQGTVRLAHQRVLESWARARKITSASAEFYRVRQEVEDEQQRWEASGRKHDLLIPAGLPLAEAENIRTRYAGELSREVCGYIDASSLRGRARRAKQQRIAVAAFALLAVIASAAGVWALKQQQQAEDALRQSRASTSRFLADLARQRLGEDRLGEAVALARRAVPLEIKDWPRVATAENALALAMQAYSSAIVRPVAGYVGHEGTVRGAAFSPTELAS